LVYKELNDVPETFFSECLHRKPICFTFLLINIIDVGTAKVRKTLVTDDWTNEGYEFDANGFYANQAAAEKIIKEPETVKAIVDNLGTSIMTAVSTKDLSGLPSTMVGKITMNEVIDAKDAFESMTYSLESIGILFTYEFDDNIHDRYDGFG